MKKIISILVFFLSAVNIYSQPIAVDTVSVPVINSDEDNSSANVLSYYGVGNSLDGQPLINTVNLLRFFPVFNLREVTNKVKVTLYVGNKVYTREAIKKDDGRYWEINLPTFQLGEAIQRLDVETNMVLNNEEYRDYISKINASNDSIRSVLAEFRKKLVNDSAIFYKNLNALSSKKSSDTVNFNSILDLIDSVKIINIGKIAELNEQLFKINTLINKSNNENLSINQSVIELMGKFKEFMSYIDDLSKKSLNRTQEQMQFIKDLKKELKNSINQQAKNSGPSINESDIIFTFENNEINLKILYRNYKKELRQLVSLDPAEKSGIFRVRYIPFPIIGNKLYKPMQNNSIYVFEFGLGFGNIAFAGDDFIKPVLSAERLGIAFAISSELFNKNAKVMAIVLTYDFNAYGSIGIGANFKSAGDESDNIQPYFSFGINKGAFEDLVKGLNKLFQ